jgi:hypothetical protein
MSEWPTAAQIAAKDPPASTAADALHAWTQRLRKGIYSSLLT